MKKVVRMSAFLFLLGLMAWGTGCDDGESPPNPQEQIKKSWHLGTAGFIKQDGIDVSSSYPGIEVTLKSDGSYATTNAKKLFFPVGTWQWEGSGTSKVILDGDFDVTVFELTANTLQIEFTMNVEDVNTNGRSKAVVGAYIMRLTAKP